MSDRRTTDALIRQLGESRAPAPFSPAAAAGGMLVLLAAGLGLYFAVFGLRHDLAAAILRLPVQAKTVLPVVLAVSAMWLALRSSRPEGRVVLWPLAVPVGLAGGLVLMRMAQADGPWPIEAAGKTALVCLASITFLSVLPLGAGIVLLRHAAPVRPVLTGALLGIAAGAGVAGGYALHCTEDSPLFFVLWYGIAIVLTGGFGAWLGQRFLRW